MPTRDTSWPPGTPCWIDYAAEDIDEARAFYTDVLGWSYTGGDEAFGGYLVAQTKGLNAAGLMPKMAAEQPSAWVTYFATADIQETAKRTSDAGGTLVAGPHQVDTLGEMLVAMDPQGMVFGAWQAGDHTGFQIFNEPGSDVWNEASSSDPAGSREFYGKVFGFSFSPFPGAGDYQTFSVGGDPLGGIGGLGSGGPVGWMPCFAVADTDAAVASATKSGAKVLTEPKDSPWGRFAVVADPWGAAFELMGYNPDAN